MRVKKKNGGGKKWEEFRSDDNKKNNSSLLHVEASKLKPATCYDIQVSVGRAAQEEEHVWSVWSTPPFQVTTKEEEEEDSNEDQIVSTNPAAAAAATGAKSVEEMGETKGNGTGGGAPSSHKISHSLAKLKSFARVVGSFQVAKNKSDVDAMIDALSFLEHPTQCVPQALREKYRDASRLYRSLTRGGVGGNVAGLKVSNALRLWKRMEQTNEFLKPPRNKPTLVQVGMDFGSISISIQRAAEREGPQYVHLLTLRREVVDEGMMFNSTKLVELETKRLEPGTMDCVFCGNRNKYTLEPDKNFLVSVRACRHELESESMTSPDTPWTNETTIAVKTGRPESIVMLNKQIKEALASRDFTVINCLCMVISKDKNYNSEDLEPGLEDAIHEMLAPPAAPSAASIVFLRSCHDEIAVELNGAAAEAKLYQWRVEISSEKHHSNLSRDMDTKSSKPSVVFNTRPDTVYQVKVKRARLEQLDNKPIPWSLFSAPPLSITTPKDPATIQLESERTKYEMDLARDLKSAHETHNIESMISAYGRFKRRSNWLLSGDNHSEWISEARLQDCKQWSSKIHAELEIRKRRPSVPRLGQVEESSTSRSLMVAWSQPLEEDEQEIQYEIQVWENPMFLLSDTLVFSAKMAPYDALKLHIPNLKPSTEYYARIRAARAEQLKYAALLPDQEVRFIFFQVFSWNFSFDFPTTHV